MAKKKEKLINILERQLKSGGFEYEKDSWVETLPVKDKCAWLNIFLPFTDDKRYSVHLYFEDNETTLTEVAIYEQTRSWKEDDASLISRSIPKL